MGMINKGVRDAFRSVPRTVAIVLILGLSIGLSFVMLIGHKSVESNIDATLATLGNTVNIAPAGANAGTTSNKYLTTAELSKVAHLSDVAALDETLGSGARLGGERVGFVATNDPTNPVNIGASTLTIVAGHAIDGTVDTDDAMVSTTLAKRNHLKVGSTFRAYGALFTVKAIFDSDTANGDDTIIVPLATSSASVIGPVRWPAPSLPPTPSRISATSLTRSLSRSARQRTSRATPPRPTRRLRRSTASKASPSTASWGLWVRRWSSAF